MLHARRVHLFTNRNRALTSDDVQLLCRARAYQSLRVCPFLSMYESTKGFQYVCINRLRYSIERNVIDSVEWTNLH